MANVNNPFGFAYVSMYQGHPPRMREFPKVVADATAIFQNDVVMENTGVAATPTPPISSFAEGTPGTTIPLGVAQSYGAASTATRHMVCVDYETYWVAQDNDPTTGILGTNIGKNANVDPTGVAGSVTTGFSGNQIAISGIATTNSLDLHLISLFPDVNNAFGPHARVIVRFNKMREMGQIAGV